MSKKNLESLYWKGLFNFFNKNLFVTMISFHKIAKLKREFYIIFVSPGILNKPVSFVLVLVSNFA